MDNLEWRRSKWSGGSGNCIEVAVLPAERGYAVRDSKDPRGPVLRFTSAEWRAFLHGVKAGEFDE